MKRIILLLSFVFALTSNAQSLNPVVDNYSRIFRIDRMFIDYNNNEKEDLDEFFIVKRDAECYFSIDFKEYADEGNIITLCFEIVNRRAINYENVYFFADRKDNFTTYSVYNNQNELVCMLIHDDAKKENTLAVYDLQLIK